MNTEEYKKDLEARGKQASQEITEILKKYELSFAVDIHMAQDFISSLKPILTDNKKQKTEDVAS